jgi:5'-deoxy-5'-methylthioadenosine phosphorylase
MSGQEESRLGIIGGSGVEVGDLLDHYREVALTTAYGEPSQPYAIGALAGREVVYLHRHGAGKQIAPHRINYRANIDGFRQLGVRHIVAYAAVGGISAEASTGAIVVPDQIVDYTHSRAATFHDGATGVEFVDFTEPYDATLRAALIAAADRIGISVVRQGTYGATQGPRLESAAEIRRMAQDGCTVVGMTGMPEAALAREARIDYATLAIVANRAAGLTPGALSIEEIIRTLRGRQAAAALMLREAVRALPP